MSNNIGLALSMLLLTFIIMFSVEVINYQKAYARLSSINNNIAIRFQHDGFDYQVAENIELDYENVGLRYTYSDDAEKKLELNLYSNYESIFKPFSFMNGIMKSTLIVYL